MVRRPKDREPATRLAIWIVVLLSVFAVMVDGYLFYLAVH
jgi:hypothetical protein